MSIAVTGALLLGQWPEAAMVMVLFTMAELIEAKSLDRARNAIQGLMQLTPEPPPCCRPMAVGRVDAKAVAIGRRVRVKPGERIALDGTIVSGVHHQPGAHHRRKPAGGKGRGRCRVSPEPSTNPARLSTRDRSRERQHAGAHHPRGGRGAGRACAHAALCGPVCPVYTPVVFAIALAVAVCRRC
jgi:Cd2+/Zn2+-exporting ATPase